jgi:hypothetical protein
MQRSTTVAVLLWALGALAQPVPSEAGPSLAPRVVNPGGADALAELDRSPGLEAPDAGVGAPEVAAPQAAPAQAGDGWNLRAGLGFSFRGSYQWSPVFPIDAELTHARVAPFETRVRATPEIGLGRFTLVGEADAATGAWGGIPAEALVGTRVPYPALQVLALRKLYLEYTFAAGVVRVGQQASSWGLGLVANDGAVDPEAGDFGQKHFGDLTYRALFAVHPFLDTRGVWKAFELALAADLVVRDDTARFDTGDRAYQGVLTARFVKDDAHQAGLYAVYRSQRNVNDTTGGGALDVFVIDAAAKWAFQRGHGRVFKLGFEAAGITGTTTLGRNENAAQLKVRQLGGALKASAHFGHTVVFFDAGYASGDQNPMDDRAENFRFDRDYKVGLVLFDQVLAYQSARAGVRAGAELLGTGGAVTGAWYLFPRVKVSLSDWLDGFGGPLFAFSSGRLTDPVNTRLAGGTSLNFLGGQPGFFLGTELDVGAQARFRPVPELLLSVTGEGGVFLPGEGFAQATGGVMAPVGFVRVRLGVGL